MSPTGSPSLSPIPSRKTFLRRGSASASDPYGKHLDVNANPARTISSRLTIVRVEPQQPEQEPPRSSSPQHFRDRRPHKRHGSSSSVGSNQGDSGRLSFAFTTFGPTNGSNGGRSSPTSGRTTPGSPQPQQRKIPSFSKPRLAPEQVIELARSSTHPKSSQSNFGSSSIPTSISAPNFTPLPDDVYLPFIDRPAEVSALISTPPTAKLFTLLTQAFPLDARQLDENVTLADFVEKDPKLWTRAELDHWFRHVDRDVASDEEWAVKARACVHSHSELLWERIKGALGVPPELDVSEGEIMEEEGSIGGLDASLVLSPIDVDHKPDFSLADHNPGNHADVFDDDYDTHLSIEPVFASDPNVSQSTDPQVGLGDISEAAEEEAENADVEEETSPPPSKQEDVVHGLRISTSFPASGSHLHGNTSSAITSPIATTSGDNGGTPAPSNVEGGYRLRRSNSSSSSIHLDGRLSPYFVYRGAHDDCYNGMERGPGNPLFPSNFANLTTSPTLRSNLQRRSSLPHQPWSSIRAALAKRRGSTLAMSEYAMTTASEGSVVGEA